MFLGLVIRAPPRREPFPSALHCALKGQFDLIPHRKGLAFVWAN